MDGSTQTQTSSQLISEGVYGCAFTPPLPCKQSKYKSKQGKKVVGKITTKKEAEIELRLATLIEAIPNYKDYYIIQEQDNCRPTNFSRLRSMYASECEQIEKRSDESLVQLLSPFGGIELKEYKNFSQFKFRSSLLHMAKAIAALEAQGICHSDLHMGNAVIDAKGVMRIIDFGISYLGDSISSNEVMRLMGSYSPSFDQMTPEFTTLLAIQDGVDVNYAITEIVQKKKIITMAQNYLGVGMTFDTQEAALRKFFREPGVYALATKNPAEFYHKFWRRVDVWGVGNLFVKLLKKCLLSPTFIETQWKKDGPIIKEVLKGFLQCNPYERMGAHEAVKLLSS